MQPVRPEHAGEGGADAVEHRVAAGQHAHPPVRQLGEQPGQRGQHRRGPRAEVGLGVPGDEVELPRPAQQHLGRPDGRTPRLGEPGPPVGADADDGHGLHGASFRTAPTIPPAQRHEPGAVARSRAVSSASSATNHSWLPRFDSRTKSRSAVLPSTWSLTSPTTTSRSR